MEVAHRSIAVEELCEGYANDDVEGVYGYGGRLDIRPQYQREFVYKGDQRDEVVRTVMAGFPLNVMYWARKVDDGDAYEVLDGQQRTISICDYVDGAYSVDEKYFDNLPGDIRRQILGYELDVYVCSGADSEKLDWFRIVNIAGEKLTDQELRNAVYAGPWTAAARRYFSKPNGAAYTLAKDYLTGTAIRQAYLETALKWIADRGGGTIEGYMGRHQHDPQAVELQSYFRDVIEWAEAIFPEYRREMKGVEWGFLYNAHHDRNDLDPADLGEQVRQLMEDDEVTSKNGIYEYVLTGDSVCLNLRTFDDKQKREAYERQGGMCPQCGNHFEYEEMDGDHKIPWSQGGKTTPENCQMLCRACNRSNPKY